MLTSRNRRKEYKELHSPHLPFLLRKYNWTLGLWKTPPALFEGETSIQYPVLGDFFQGPSEQQLHLL